MPSLYRCRKYVLLKSEDNVLENPPEYIVEAGVDLDEIREISEAINEEGAVYWGRCIVHFYNGDRVMLDMPFGAIFEAWQQASNKAVLLRRFG